MELGDVASCWVGAAFLGTPVAFVLLPPPLLLGPAAPLPLEEEAVAGRFMTLRAEVTAVADDDVSGNLIVCVSV